MTYFALRRRRNLLILAFLVFLCLVIYQGYSLSLRSSNYISGWILFFLLCVLSLYNVRKKLPFLPLIDSSSWLQFHVYAGYMCVVLFILHTDWRMPNGWLEGTLTGFYTAVVGSGIAGLIISRTVPSRLTTRGEEVIFERIPRFLKQLCEQMHTLVEQAIAVTDEKEYGDTIAGFYARRLVSFFDRPRNFWWHLFQSNRPYHTLMKELDGLERYLNDDEKEIAQALAELIRAKDDLDYQYAHQALLKYWLFVHVPLTYSLLIFALVHGILAHAFSRGV